MYPTIWFYGVITLSFGIMNPYQNFTRLHRFFSLYIELYRVPEIIVFIKIHMLFTNAFLSDLSVNKSQSAAI